MITENMPIGSKETWSCQPFQGDFSVEFLLQDMAPQGPFFFFPGMTTTCRPTGGQNESVQLKANFSPYFGLLETLQLL